MYLYNSRPTSASALWTSKRTLTLSERCVAWRFTHRWARPVLWLAIVLLACAIYPVSAVMASLSASAGAVAFFLLWGIVVAILAFMLDLGGTDEWLMRRDIEFRFPEMQSGAPSFDVAMHYCGLVRMAQAHGRPTSIPEATVDYGPSLGVFEIDLTIERWLERQWQSDASLDQEDTSPTARTQRAQLIVDAVNSFMELGLPLPPGFETFCLRVTTEAVRGARREVQRETRRARRWLARMERMEYELGSLRMSASTREIARK